MVIKVFLHGCAFIYCKNTLNAKNPKKEQKGE